MKVRLARRPAKSMHVLACLHDSHGVADESSRPLSCPDQMASDVGARIVDRCQEHPAWGPRMIL
jgi:hypothetical protein